MEAEVDGIVQFKSTCTGSGDGDEAGQSHSDLPDRHSQMVRRVLRDGRRGPAVRESAIRRSSHVRADHRVLLRIVLGERYDAYCELPGEERLYENVRFVGVRAFEPIKNFNSG